jgi:2'-hydroxyisoflavone reductase
MDLLVIGGTHFSGRALAEQALRAGHRVTVFHRNPTDVLPEAEHVLGDREEGVDAVAGRTFDAVVDMCGYVPRAVNASIETLASSGWYGFVSSISAHLDGLTAGATEDAPIHGPPYPDTEDVTEETYGPLKAACERVVRDAFGDRAAVVRPGYIVGPNDPTDRFTSWVRRASKGGEMLAPGPAGGAIQFVDARDLAAFLLHLAEGAIGGTYNAIHPPGTLTRGGLLSTATREAGADTSVVWADPQWLVEQLGDDRYQAFPMWDEPDEPGAPGSHLLDPSRAIAAGLRNRAVDETIRDTLTWDRSRGPDATRECGLTTEREKALLDAWRVRSAAG